MAYFNIQTFYMAHTKQTDTRKSTAGKTPRTLLTNAVATVQKNLITCCEFPAKCDRKIANVAVNLAL